MAWQISKGRLDRLVVFATVSGTAVPMGELVFEGGERIRRGFFRYARTWLARPDKRAIDPVGLPLRAKATWGDPHEVPLVFWDAAPDGWGRSILQAAFPNQTFGMAEFLAASGDDRTGDLRFGASPESGPAQWDPGGGMLDLPAPSDSLVDLLEAAEAVEAGRATRHHFQRLFRSSADIGGARPKTRLRADGVDWIAKFPARDDAYDDPRIEAACLGLAQAAGIETPNHRVLKIGERSVLLVQRFDRESDGKRLPYLSAATLMKHRATDYRTSESYADLAATARAGLQASCERELFRRMLLNGFIHNTDDHLRNHAFIYRAGWKLSPVFDITPHPGSRMVLRPSRKKDPVTDPAALFSAYSDFRLELKDAIEIYDQVASAMSRLKHLLDECEVSEKDRTILRDLMPSAFAPPTLDRKASGAHSSDQHKDKAPSRRSGAGEVG